MSSEMKCILFIHICWSCNSYFISYSQITPMSFSRGKMLVSLVDNKLKSTGETTGTNPEIGVSNLNTNIFIANGFANIKGDVHITDSNKSTSTVNITEDNDLDQSERNELQNIIFPSEKYSEENWIDFNLAGHLLSSSEKVLLDTSKENEHLSVNEMCLRDFYDFTKV